MNRLLGVVVLYRERVKTMLEAEPTAIEAEVYHSDPAKDRYFIKVTFLGSGMYINSFSVMPSQFEDKPYWVQPPKHRKGKGWGETVEFDKNYPLWKIIEHKAIEAVKIFKNDVPIQKPNDVVVEDIPDGPINLDDIPF